MVCTVTACHNWRSHSLNLCFPRRSWSLPFITLCLRLLPHLWVLSIYTFNSTQLLSGVFIRQAILRVQPFRHFHFPGRFHVHLRKTKIWLVSLQCSIQADTSISLLSPLDKSLRLYGLHGHCLPKMEISSLKSMLSMVIMLSTFYYPLPQVASTFVGPVNIHL